jgi:hypothetical protein
MDIKLLLLLLAGFIIIALALLWGRRRFRARRTKTKRVREREIAVPARPLLERMDGKPLDYIEETIIPENATIVGVRKPVGKWTRMIFAEKMDYIMGKLGGKEEEGYWVKLIQAEKQSRDRQGPER